MATATLRPTSDVANTWSVICHANRYTCVDDVVTQPTAGDGLYIGATFGNGDDNDIQIFGFPTIADISEVTNITVWSYVSGFASFEVSVDMGGVQAYQELNQALGVVYEWESNSFDGSWSQSDLDGLEVLYRADTPDPGKGPSGNNIDVCYVVVTYSVGYTASNPLGVPIANVASVMGVPIANIESIKGV